MPPLETELTTHAGALRALARVLVGEHHADDLVQETVLQVVAAPPARPTGLRGWLVAVMRHRAGKHHRGERRRQLRERAMPEAEPMASPARIVEHADTLRRLTAALTGLPEPYLGTLMLRFFEDLPPTAIAERTGVPVTTVKSRLQRGLAMLRQRLAAADEDWRASLGALFGGIALPVAATTTTGVLLMSSATKLVLGGATLVAALLIWASIDPGSGSPDPGRAAPADPRLSTAAIDAPTATDPADEVADVTATRTTPDAPSPEVVIHGRCVDESGLPLGGCAVTLRGHRVEGVGKDFAREYAEWLRARGSNDWQDQRFVTGGDGTFEFAVAPSPLSLQLSLSRDRLEFLSSIGQMLRPATRDLGDLLVPATCAVDIRVIDSRGLPVATPVLSVDRSPGADATATGAGPFARPLPPELHAGGAFTSLLAAGDYTCRVIGREPEQGQQLVVPPGAATFRHTVVVASLPTDEVLAGIVVDEREQPLSGVDVWASNRVTSTSARTDANGRFVLCRPAEGGLDVTLFAAIDAYEALTLPAPVRFGGDELRLVLRDAGAVAVHVVADADGAPVLDFVVRTGWGIGADPDMYRDEGAARGGDHHDDGTALLSGISRGAHLLVVEPLGLDLWRSAALPIAVTVPGPTRVEVRLGAAADRPLRVLAGDHAPVAEVSCEPVAADADRGAGGEIVELGRWQPSKPGQRVLVGRVETDARGEAVLHGPADRPLLLRLTAGDLQQVVTPIRLDEPTPLEVVLPSPTRLVVHVTPPAMVRELRRVAGFPDDGPAPRRGKPRRPGFRLILGNGRGAETRPAADEPATAIAGDGTVEFVGAPAGNWTLGLQDWDEHNGEVLCWGSLTALADVTLQPGVTTELDLDLSAQLPGELVGTVTCNGSPAIDSPIGIEIERQRPGQPHPRRWLVNSRTDAEGRFRLSSQPGSIRVAVDRTAELPVTADGAYSYQLVYSDDKVYLPPGRQLEATFAIAAGTLRLRLLDAERRPVAGVRVVLQGPGDWQRHRPAPSDADGSITCAVETTTFRVLALPRAQQDDAAQAAFVRDHGGDRTALTRAHVEIGRFSVSADASAANAEVELQLPAECYR